MSQFGWSLGFGAPYFTLLLLWQQRSSFGHKKSNATCSLAAVWKEKRAGMGCEEERRVRANGGQLVPELQAQTLYGHRNTLQSPCPFLTPSLKAQGILGSFLPFTAAARRMAA